MKEFSIEEKAKAYDEAKARISKAYNDNRCTIGFMNEIFPSLKESEDERTWIINYLSNRILNSTIIAEKENLKKAIAWLEKQDEQIQVIDYPNNLPKDNWELIHEFVNKFGRMPKDEDELNVLIEYVLKRQNPAWSEEDKKYLNNLYRIINSYRENTSNETDKARANGCEKWLKSLKDRVQPKQEWSEEDKNMLQSILDEYKSMPTEKRNWLKSLKERYTWKPSDEQMEALEHFVRSIGESGYASPYDNNTKLLYLLLEQLKKLRIKL
jgi:hypothetical protein